jgi:hypothetical protein
MNKQTDTPEYVVRVSPHVRVTKLKAPTYECAAAQGVPLPDSHDKRSTGAYWVTGHDDGTRIRESFTFPKRCACCGKQAPSTLSLKADGPPGSRAALSCSLPYCRACLSHVRLVEKAAQRASIVPFFLAGTPVAFLILRLLHCPAAYSLLGSLFAAFGGLMIFLASRKTRRSAHTSMREECASVGAAARLDLDGDDKFRFTFRSRSYAEAFAAANSGKVESSSTGLAQSGRPD